MTLESFTKRDPLSSLASLGPDSANTRQQGNNTEYGGGTNCSEKYR